MRVLGIVEIKITLDSSTHVIRCGVIPADTMSVPILVGRDALKLFGYKLTKSPIYDKAVSDILHIEVGGWII